MKPNRRAVALRRQLFDDLYARHAREVWAVAYARWMDADSAQDVTQEAFLRLWKQMEDAGGEAIQNPRAWLMRVARNLAEDAAKSAFRRFGTQPPEQMNAVQSAGSQPLEQMAREETFGRIRGLLDELPAADREILTLRYALEYDTPAIADALGIAVSAVHMRLSRARQRLEERLTAAGIVAPGPNP